MKQLLRNFLQRAGLIPYIDVFREKFFPTKYYKESLIAQGKYVSFYSQFIKQGDTCFDIGAHHGHRTGIFLKMGAKVIAVEPQKECFKYLQLKFGNKITLLNYGLADKEGVQEMFINSASSLSTFSKDWAQEATSGRFANTKWVSKSMVQIKTLDLLIQQYGVPVFCKIDVESYEYEVLKGLSQPIPFISFEFMLPENLDIAKKCILHLLSINPNAQLNYSAEDNLELGLKNWVRIDEHQKFFDQQIFKEPSWGDIYIKMS